MNIIDTYSKLDSLENSDKHVLLLFSGGLDSCHTLSLLKKKGWTVTTLTVGLGEPIPETLSVSKDLADNDIYVYAEHEFCNEFLAEGIRCNATYYGGMPLSSTFTRPLIAKIAAKYAREQGINIIASNVTAFQNSFFRFAKSIEILAPGLSFFAPSIGSFCDRGTKINQLHPMLSPYFQNSPRGTYSIDENLWCRVVENGDIEYPERTLPIFEIRGEPWEGEEEYIDIEFQYGLPVAINGKEMTISELVGLLNKKFSGHPASFFYGLEGNVFGVKNPEPRTSMAARLIHDSSNLLSQAILSTAELQLRSELSSRFALSAVEGGWFSSHQAVLRSALNEIARFINGVARWRIDAHSCDPSQIVPKSGSKIGSHYSGFSDSVESFGLSEKITFDVMREHTHV